MPISTKTVRNTNYVYFVYYDPKTKKKKEIYCGPSASPKSKERAEELEKEYLEKQIVSIQSQLKEYETVEQTRATPRRKRRSHYAVVSEKTDDNIAALRLLKNVQLYDPEVYYKSSEKMSEVPDGSIQLIATSPPYNVGKAYATYNDKREMQEYLDFLGRVWKESKRVLCSGGRIAINVADTFRQPYIPLHTYITQQMIDLGFLMRGIVYWDKGASAGISTAWGSWRSASNPTIRDIGEYILIFSKDSFKLQNESKVSTISSNQFTTYTKSIWSFPATDPKKAGHPAPFPDELPKRLIQFYTFLGDTVLDPFLGSGTTCKVAKAWGRRSIGYEVDESYRPVIEKKISETSSLAIPLDAFSVNGKGKAVEDYLEEIALVSSSTN
jgi:DNA modification methylase